MNSLIGGFGQPQSPALCSGDRLNVRLGELLVFLAQKNSHCDCDCGCSVKERSNVQLMEATIPLMQRYIEKSYQSHCQEVPAQLTKAHVAQPWNKGLGNNGGNSSCPEINHATLNSSPFGRHRSRNSQQNHLNHPISQEHGSHCRSDTISYKDNHGSKYSSKLTDLQPETFLEPAVPSDIGNMRDEDAPPADITTPDIGSDEAVLSRNINQQVDKSSSKRSDSRKDLEKEHPQHDNMYTNETENKSLLPAHKGQSPQSSLQTNSNSTSILAQNASGSHLQESNGASTVRPDQTSATDEGGVANAVAPSNKLPETPSRSTTPEGRSNHTPANTNIPQLSMDSELTDAIIMTSSRQSSTGERSTIADKEPTLTSSNILQLLDPSLLLTHEDHPAPARLDAALVSPVNFKVQLARLPGDWQYMLKKKRDGESWTKLAQYYEGRHREHIKAGTLSRRYQELCKKEPWVSSYVGEPRVGRKRNASPIERLGQTSRTLQVPSRTRKDKEDIKRTRGRGLRATMPSATNTDQGTKEAFEEWYAQGSSKHHKIMESNNAESDEYHPDSEDNDGMDDAGTSRHQRSSKHPVKRNASESSKAAGLDPSNASRRASTLVATSNWQDELNTLQQDMQFVAKKRREGVKWKEIIENYNLFTGKDTTEGAMRIKFQRLKKGNRWLPDYVSGRERIQADTRSYSRLSSVVSQQNDYDDDDDNDGEV